MKGFQALDLCGSRFIQYSKTARLARVQFQLTGCDQRTVHQRHGYEVCRSCSHRPVAGQGKKTENSMVH